jgi:hypothetical protein
MKGFWPTIREAFAEPQQPEPYGAPPKPRIAVVRRAPAREEFAAWRDEPVTRFVFAALRSAAGAQHDAWADTSWEGGLADQNLLNELRVRADAYKSLEEADYEGFCEWAGVDPEPLAEGANG